MDYRTDFSEMEKKDAIFKLIKNYKSLFYETKYENIINIISNSKKCIYCNSEHDKQISIKTNLLIIGYFCCDLCKIIYYSIIKFIFNLPDLNIIMFIPFYLLDEESKNKYNDIKLDIENYDYKNIILLSKFLNNDIFTKIRIIFNDKYIELDYNFKYKLYSNKCFYCNSQINKSIILETKYNDIVGFCSKICKDSVSKQIYTILIPKFKYNTYLIPYELVKEKDKIDNIIKYFKNEYCLYGGYNSYNKLFSKIEFFIPK